MPGFPQQAGAAGRAWTQAGLEPSSYPCGTKGRCGSAGAGLSLLRPLGGQQRNGHQGPWAASGGGGVSGTRSQLRCLWAHVPGRGLWIECLEPVSHWASEAPEKTEPEKPPSWPHHTAYDPPSQPPPQEASGSHRKHVFLGGVAGPGTPASPSASRGSQETGTGRILGWGSGAGQRSRQHRSRGGRRATAEGRPSPGCRATQSRGDRLVG